MSRLGFVPVCEGPFGLPLGLAVAGFGLFGAAASVGLSEVRPLRPILSGRVAARRAKALAKSPLLRVAELGLGFIVAAFWDLPGLKVRAHRFLTWQRRILNLAGNPLALGAEEFPVVALLAGCGAGALTIGLGIGVNLGLAVAGLVMVGAYVRIMSLGALRRRLAGRDMPRHMDLLALCMSSGMDLVAALTQVAAGDRGVLAEEIGYLLRTLELGQTRRAALAELAESLPAPEVEDFCRAVIQAEIKGASVREALVQQAVMSRVRRSVRAEEMAARAGVLLVGPMMMLVVCLVLLILGPMLVGQKWM
jgi:tight adherence protein C